MTQPTTAPPFETEGEHVCAYLAFCTTTGDRGYLGISRTLAGAMLIAESAEMAEGYFSTSKMEWSGPQDDPESGDTHWTGQIQTSPYQSPTEFEIRKVAF